MAVSAPRTRPWSTGRVPVRWLLVGVVILVVLAGVYVALEGNPLTSNQQAVTYDTSRVNQGTLQVTANAFSSCACEACPKTRPALSPSALRLVTVVLRSR